MSLDGNNFPQIHVENVVDYTQYITQVANLDPSLATLQGLHGLQSLPDGTTVAFIDSSILEASHLLDNGSIEVHQALSEGTIDLQQCQQVVLEQPIMEQIVGVNQALEVPDVKPPIGKGPFNCSLCDKVFSKWNQLQRHLKTHDEDKPFRCNQCTMSYNLEENLSLHLATHVGVGEDPRCPECGKKFSRVASLKAHIMLHEKDETLMCPECGDEFSVQHQLDRHMQEHREEHVGSRSYQCKQCDLHFPRLALLREHMKQHYRVKASLHHRTYKRNIDRTGFSQKCKHCHKMFQKPSQLLRHERIHTGERPFVCNICDKTFNQKGALQMHMSKHTGDKPHTCDFCPMTFAQKGNLRSHIKRVHTLPKEENGLIYKCDECSCMFRRLGSLNAHISRAHAENEEPPATTAMVHEMKGPPLQHGLPLSDMNESSMIGDMLGLDQVNGGSDLGSSSLVDGQVIQGTLDQGASDILQQALENSGLPSTVEDDHEGDGGKENAAAVSNINNNTTNNNTGAAAHGTTAYRVGTMTVHDSTSGLFKRHYVRKVNGIRWHQCTYCTKEFKKPSDLVRHIRIHTHEKPYKCTQCFRAFAVKSTLTAHIKTHTGVKDFCCEVCNKLFSTQGSLKVHLRLHTGARPFDCSHCDKKFRTSAHCKTHTMSHFKNSDISPRQRRPIKRPRHESLLPDIPMQEPIMITEAGLIQQQPRSSDFVENETVHTDRPFKCTHCRRGFKKSSHLKQHVRSHTGEKPFRCNVCFRSFVSSGVLKAHSRTHSGEKSHKCLVCDAMFTTSGSLKRHMSIHSESRPFMCPYCQKTFKTSVNCKKHMKTHRHELALQHLRTMKDTETTDASDVIVRRVVGEEEDDGEIVEENTLTEPQTLDDLDVLQDQEIGHTTTVTQPDLQVVDVNQTDLITSDTLNMDSGLQQAFNQGMFGHNFTLIGQQPFLQLTTTETTGQSGQEDGRRAQDAIPRVTVQLDGNTLSSSVSQSITGPNSTQFTYQPQSIQVASPASELIQQQQQTPQEQQQQQQTQYIENGNIVTIQEHVVQEMEDKSHIPHPPTATTTGSNNIIIHTNNNTTNNHHHHNNSHLITSGGSNNNAGHTKRGLRCHVCNKIFKRANHLTQHLRVHRGEVRSFQCSQCPEAFFSAALLRRHSVVHTLRLYACALCTNQFHTAMQLRKHIKECKALNIPSSKNEIVENGNEENLEPRRLRRRSNPVSEATDEQVSISERILMESASEKDRISMPKEVQTHTIRRGRFANTCPQCPKSFKKPSDLQRHIRTHTGEKPFVCATCLRSFTVKSTLDSHMKTHEALEKSFICHVCSSMFSTKGSLKVHMRLHTGAKPFKCTMCDQRFRTSGHRKSHMATHFKSESVVKKKPTKSQTGPLQQQQATVVAVSQDNAMQPQMLILTNTAGPQGAGPNVTSLSNQVLSMDQSLASQVVGAASDQTGLAPHQVISVDSSMLQNPAAAGATSVMPVQLANVADGSTVDVSAGLPQVIQGLDGSLHLTGSLSQLGQNLTTVSGLDSTVLQQAIHIDASLLQQLQQNGFVTINSNTLQPNNIQVDLGGHTTSDLSNVQSSSHTVTNQSEAGLISHHQQVVIPTCDGGPNGEGLIGQPIPASEALINQMRNQQALFVQSLNAGSAGNTTQTSHEIVVPKMEVTQTPAHTMVTHRVSDSLLSQQSVRRGGVSTGVTDSLLGQGAASSHHDNYIQISGSAVQMAGDGGAMIGHDGLIATSMSLSDPMIGRQITQHAMGAVNDGSEHSLLQTINLPGSLPEGVIVRGIQSTAHPHPTHPHTEQQDHNKDLETTTFVTPDGQMVKVQSLNVIPGGSGQELNLIKLGEVVGDEEDSKYSEGVGGHHPQIVTITQQLDQSSGLVQPGNPLEEDEEEEDEEEEEGGGEVDTTALIPTGDVQHMDMQGSERQHICGICYRGFKRATHLRDHVRTHEPGALAKKPKATPHKCNVCLKAFQKPSQVDRHMRIHTGERPFACTVCDKAFNQKNALEVHLRKHRGEKPHICPYCNASFVQSGNLKTHVKRAHHLDMVNSMNLTAARGSDLNPGSSEQVVGTADSACGVVGGVVDQGAVVGSNTSNIVGVGGVQSGGDAEMDGGQAVMGEVVGDMDLEQVVDLFGH